MYVALYADVEIDRILARRDIEKEWKAEESRKFRQVERDVPKRARRNVGYVYLMMAGPRYKIGITTSLQRRLSQLNSGQAPFPVEVVHAVHCSDYQSLEKDLHRAHWWSKEHGEWFAFKPEEIAAVIEAMNEWSSSHRVEAD